MFNIRKATAYITFSVITSFLFSQNTLYLISEGGKPFKLILNGLTQNTIPQTIVKADSITETTLKVGLIFENEVKIELQSDIFLLMNGKPVSGMDFTYAVYEDKTGKTQLRFISINESGKLPEPLVPPEPMQVIPLNLLKADKFGSVCIIEKGTKIYHDNLPEDKKCKNPLSEVDFKFVCQLITQAGSSDQQIKTAQAFAERNCFSAVQVKQMVALINFEVDRYKLAKTAYPNITDKSEADIVAESFHFPNTKSDYLKYISDLKNKHE